MSFTIACQKCGTRLAIPDSLYEKKIKGHIVTIGCKKCSADIRVDGTKAREDTESKSKPPTEPAKAAPKPDPEARPATEAAEAPKAERKTEEQPQPVVTKAASEPWAAQEPAAKAEDKASPAGPSPAKKAPPTEPKSPAASLGSSPFAAKAVAKRPAVAVSKALAPDVLWSVSYADDDDRDMNATQIAAALRRGEIDEETIVWNEDMDDWKPIAEVSELAKLAAPARAPGRGAAHRRTATLADAPAAKKERESRSEEDKELARAAVDHEGPTIRRDELPIPAASGADKPAEVSGLTEGKPAEVPAPIISPFTKEAADDEDDVVSSLSAEELAGALEKKKQAATPVPKPVASAQQEPAAAAVAPAGLEHAPAAAAEAEATAEAKPEKAAAVALPDDIPDFGASGGRRKQVVILGVVGLIALAVVAALALGGSSEREIPKTRAARPATSSPPKDKLRRMHEKRKEQEAAAKLKERAVTGVPDTPKPEAKAAAKPAADAKETEESAGDEGANLADIIRRQAEKRKSKK